MSTARAKRRGVGLAGSVLAAAMTAVAAVAVVSSWPTAAVDVGQSIGAAAERRVPVQGQLRTRNGRTDIIKAKGEVKWSDIELKREGQ